MNTYVICNFRYLRYIGIIGYLLILFGISGCAGLLSPQATEEQPPEDVTLAISIKVKLIETKELNAAAINVDASNGVVILNGFVETESQRQLANSIAKQNPKVKQVDNKIIVK